MCSFILCMQGILSLANAGERYYINKLYYYNYVSHIREARKLSCCIRSVKRILWRCMVALYLNLRNLYRKYAGAFTPVFDMVFQNSFRSSSYLAKPQLSQSKVCFSIHLCKQYLCFQICLCDRVWRCVCLCAPVVCVCMQGLWVHVQGLCVHVYKRKKVGGNGGKGMFATLAIWSKTAIYFLSV